MIDNPMPARRVRRLSLRAPTAEQARSSAIVVADALHTATMPAADQGRLLVIRRLALGLIDPKASGASIALQIEQAVRCASLQIEPADSPAASTAEAVAFRDCSEAIILLARRVAARQSVHDWFWPAAFPEWRPGLSREKAWRLLLQLAHRQPAPLSIAAAVAREAFRANAAAEMVAAVSVADAREWLWRSGLDPNAKPDRPRRESGEWPPIDRAIRPILDGPLSEWGGRDLRSFWLAAVALLIVRPSLSTTTSTDFSTRVGALLNRWKKSGSAGADNAAGSNEKGQDPGAQPSASEAGEVLRAEGEESYPVTGAGASDASLKEKDRRTTLLNAENAPSTITEPQYAIAAESTPKHSEQPLLDGTRRMDDVSAFRNNAELTGEWSLFSGLLFLVPILTRLGMDDFLEKNPESAAAAFPRLLLLFIGKRVGLPPSDPLAIALSDESREGAGAPDAQSTSSSPAEDTARAAAGSLYRIWLTDVRRFSRREARMGLVTLIRRRGLIMVSRTHLDICLTLDQADPRLRRQALDIDPGWVSWLGRVIRFHYDDTYRC